MKNIKLYVACFSFVFAMAGCDDITNLNNNPNEPDDTVNYNLNDPRLASTLRAGIPMEGDDEQRIKSLMLDYFAQIADGGNFSTKNYVMNEDWNRRMYRRVQSNVSSLNIVIRNLLPEIEDYRHTIAVAKIWRVFTQASGVDYFGPIPFAQYTVVEDNPPYMSVEDNYNEFFRELEEAVNMLGQESTNPIFISSNSDLLYGNSVAKWRAFANSLRLRYALRLSEVDVERCKTEAKKAIESGVMADRSGNAYLPPKANGDWGQDYNYTMFQITWGGAINMTQTFEKLVTNIGGADFPKDIFNKRNAKKTPLSNIHPEKVDLRATAMFDPAFDTGDWKGVTYGLPTAEYNATVAKSCAEMGFLYNNGTPYKSRPYDVMLFEEVCFLKAEAIERGFVTGDAKAEYEKGVQASFATWGQSAIAADDYLKSNEKNLAGTSANYDDFEEFGAATGNTRLEKIITQKYIAAFPDVSFESWNDKRRLNLPRFDVGAYRYEAQYVATNKDIKDPSNFIRRVQYPEQENQINKVEYDKGVKLLGGPDQSNTPIWWDKSKNYCTSVK
ncbi:SusD/RagB family nutrient-binding outer membrane lipoprotein [Bacteroides sp. 519]|uniref:SusD/RagB family nutrient-binding outer membrane lipoprotein n=1 Tax=Bacteroides sp. 519 TaxID=2302937 RepID=UPI0013D749CF|nr:SusD/RagB family nutrient-binding outer membrane lipoprotein [Bacteroides sp. 519]NDV57528.1 SusD/RagB family nutrient-binding outer membrane lipoprotein [Bacteroides sp. 519]